MTLGARTLQERRIEGGGNDVIGDATGRGMAPVEGERRLALHPEAGGIDHQIEAPFAVIEDEVGRIGKVREGDGVMLALGCQFIEQRPRLARITPGHDQREALVRQRGNDRARRAASAHDAGHAVVVCLCQISLKRLQEPARVGVGASHSGVGVGS